VKPYYFDEKSNVKIFNCDWRELDDETLRADSLVSDPPYGLKEAAGKNKSRNKAFGSKTSLGKNRVIQAKDYGVSDWDNEPPSDFDLIRLRDVTKYQIIFGGNYFILPPSKCWIVWDKVNSGDFADAELAWTNLDKAVRIFRWMWNGMLKEQPEFRTHPCQKPVSLGKFCLKMLPNDVKSMVDPYMGSGAFILAAKAMGISAVGVEREERYCADAVVRLEQEVFDFGGEE
jgi:DNA modification methylase